MHVFLHKEPEVTPLQNFIKNKSLYLVDVAPEREAFKQAVAHLNDEFQKVESGNNPFEYFEKELDLTSFGIVVNSGSKKAVLREVPVSKDSLK